MGKRNRGAAVKRKQSELIDSRSGEEDERRIRAWLAEEGHDHDGPITSEELKDFEREHVISGF